MSNYNQYFNLANDTISMLWLHNLIYCDTLNFILLELLSSQKVDRASQVDYLHLSLASLMTLR